MVAASTVVISHGIPNRGNTCYAAAVLQLLGHSWQILDWLLGTPPPAPSAMPPCTRELTLLFADMWGLRAAKKRHAVGPVATRDPDISALLGALTRHGDGRFTLQVHEQNDAHEFLTQLLAVILHELERSQTPRGTCEAGAPLNSRVDRMMLDDWRRHAGPYGAAGSMTHGQVLVQTKCGHCGEPSYASDIFTTLQLDVRGETVAECVQKTMATESIEDYKCEKCRRTSCAGHEARRAVRFWRLPSVLVVCLRRFGPDGVKIQAGVKRALEPLVLRPWLCSKSPHFAGGGEQARYVPKAAVLHFGSRDAGHYVTLCKAPAVKEGWLMYNDAAVIPHEGAGAPVDQGVYMVIYDKVFSFENV